MHRHGPDLEPACCWPSRVLRNLGGRQLHPANHFVLSACPLLPEGKCQKPYLCLCPVVFVYIVVRATKACPALKYAQSLITLAVPRRRPFPYLPNKFVPVGGVASVYRGW